MPTRKPSDPHAKPQSERFIEMARELGCDEDETAFKEKLKQVARHKPKNDDRGEPSAGDSNPRPPD
jgi:hypothetical protein